MVDYFCDHGAYGLTTNRLGLDTPVTWGVPQEGDGSTKDAATASSVASIAFATVPTSGLMSVCGINIGTTGVIGAATVNASADALAGLINAMATTVAAGVAVGTPRLQNLVYARGPTLGAPAGTCQIMMRIGSTLLNYASNINAAISSTFDGAPTLVQFVGGSGGCWGWFINPVAMGVGSSILFMKYGSFLYFPYCGTTPTGSDIVWVRTGGGASKTISITSVTTSMAHDNYGKVMVFDTNTKWTGDSAVGALKLDIIAAGFQSLTFTTGYSVANNYKPAAYIALRQGGFEIAATHNGIYVGGVIFAGAITDGYLAVAYKNVIWRNNFPRADIASMAPFGPSSTWGKGQTMTYDQCKYIITNTLLVVPSNVFTASGGGVRSLTFTGCEFNFNIDSIADPGALVQFHASEVPRLDYKFQGCSFLGFTAGYKPVTAIGAQLNSTSKINITFDNCSGLQMPATYAGFPSPTLTEQSMHQLFINNTANADAPGLRLEDSRGVCEWLPDSATAFPALRANNAITGAPYSLRLTWLSSVLLGHGNPYRMPDIRTPNNVGAGVKTLSVDLLVPPTVTDGIEAQFSYTSTTGVSCSERAYVLVASGLTWTGASGWSGYTAQKLQVTTANPVRDGSEIVCVVSLVKTLAASTTYVFVDPEIGIA